MENLNLVIYKNGDSSYTIEIDGLSGDKLEVVEVPSVPTLLAGVSTILARAFDPAWKQ